MSESKRGRARADLTRLGIPVGGDYHALNNEQKDALLVEVKHVRYRKPKRASGSRLRYFHDSLQRKARSEA